MNILDKISASVFKAFNGPLHGRQATYTYVAPTIPSFTGTISETATTITFTGSYTFSRQFFVKLENEYIRIVSISGQSAKVERAQLGSTAATHIFGTFTPTVKNGLTVNVVVEPDVWESMFDTGTDEIDFDTVEASISYNEIPVPVEQGRGSAGDYLVFTDQPHKTWQVRLNMNIAEISGGYFSVTLADYQGPISGV